ncbi:MAG: signal peptide peptidase SppA [Robiginitomaculum sp.]
MRQFFISILGSVIGFFIAMVLILFFVFTLAVFAVNSAKPKKTTVSATTVLSMDLRNPMLDHGNGNSLFRNNTAFLVHIVRSLHDAKTNTKIKGLLIRANGWAMSPAQSEEIRLAIKDFQSSGKFVIAHAQGFEGPSLSAYAAVSSADEIWMQDTTGFSPAGYRAEVEFLGGVFEKYDLKANFIQFKEYKNAVNTYTQKGLTKPHREAMSELLTSLMDDTVANIANDRGISEKSIRFFLQNAPHSAEQAKEASYVDKFGYWVDVKDYVKKKAGKNTNLLDIARYEISPQKGPVIAFIGGQGIILPGKSSQGGPFSNKITMGGDTVSEAFVKASKNDKVKAIVFRINSPGGSPAASDQIWDSVNRAKKAGKPVVISMGQYAASGGYYVAANADKIVAMPTTITGSIGVYGGKVAIGDAAANFGYNTESITVGGEFSAAYSPFEPWSQANRAAMYGALEDIYADFTSRVATGRNIPLDDVLKIAKGRVWTGTQAKEVGLVDELGGFMKAVEIAKKLAKIDEDTKVQIKKFPRPLTDIEQLQKMLNVSAQSAQDLKALRVFTSSPEFVALLKARTALEPQSQESLKAALPTIE